MGGRQIEEISQQLQRYGKSPQTPVAAIRACGCPQQQVWMGTLADIVRQTQGVALSPVVLVIGEVVGLRDYLRSHNGGEMSGLESATRLPLQGITVLVTRAAGQSSQFTELLEGEGAKVVEMPALEITPPSSWEELDEAIANLSGFDWLILTSSNGVDYFCDRLLSQGKDTRALAGIQIAAVGKKTAASLKERGLQPDFIPPDFVADSLVENFPEPLAGKIVLFPRVESGGREALVQGMQAQGARVREVAAYQSGCPTQIEPAALDALQQQRVDVITFASSKTAKHFLQLLKQSLPNETELSRLLANPAIASIGPQTSLTCRQLFGRVDVEAQEYTLEGLTQGIVQWITDNDRHI
jgi:uroporphyrinogen III methyltransferase/synthase